MQHLGDIFALYFVQTHSKTHSNVPERLTNYIYHLIWTSYYLILSRLNDFTSLNVIFLGYCLCYHVGNSLIPKSKRKSPCETQTITSHQCSSNPRHRWFLSKSIKKYITSSMRDRECTEVRLLSTTASTDQNLLESLIPWVECFMSGLLLFNRHFQT